MFLSPPRRQLLQAILPQCVFQATTCVKMHAQPYQLPSSTPPFVPCSAIHRQLLAGVSLRLCHPHDEQHLARTCAVSGLATTLPPPYLSLSLFHTDDFWQALLTGVILTMAAFVSPQLTCERMLNGLAPTLHPLFCPLPRHTQTTAGRHSFPSLSSSR